MSLRGLVVAFSFLAYVLVESFLSGSATALARHTTLPTLYFDSFFFTEELTLTFCSFPFLCAKLRDYWSLRLSSVCESVGNYLVSFFCLCTLLSFILWDYFLWVVVTWRRPKLLLKLCVMVGLVWSKPGWAFLLPYRVFIWLLSTIFLVGVENTASCYLIWGFLELFWVISVCQVSQRLSVLFSYLLSLWLIDF